MSDDVLTDLSIDYIWARSAMAAHWVADTMTWPDLVERITNTTTWGLSKDSGGYVLGTFGQSTVRHPKDTTDCTGLHRRSVALQSRGVLTLDADKASADLIEAVRALGVAGAAHTTWSSTPTSPRWRVLLPLARPVDGDEFVQITAWFMNHLGAEQFDPVSRKPAQLMHWPASPEGTEDDRQAVTFSGPAINPDKVLKRVATDGISLPTPSGPKTKRDPHELEGTPGDICRAYRDDLESFIETYDLPYEPEGGRWRLRGTTSMAGFGPIDGSDGLYYSHHANDPAHGEAVNLFDLYRLHKYSHLDEGCGPTTPVNRRPSHVKACEDLVTDPRVLREMLEADTEAQVDGDPDATPLDNAWMLDLQRSPRTGKITDTIANWELIAANDPLFAGLYWNDLTNAPTWEHDLPWRSLTFGGPEVSSMDRTSVALHLERRFEVRPPKFVVDSMLDDIAMRRGRNPVREYLESLEWDGVPRVETCLPGVVVTDYTRLVARKALAAAVARVFVPGIKNDHMLILHGGEGLGKTWWIERMSMGWTCTLGTIGAKDTLLEMHRSWIVNADESNSLRKADADTLKEFLTRTNDVFRSPYERSAVGHPRKFVFWATTNDETFLRAQEGNRRFLPIRVERKADFDKYTDEYVGQVWAEAVHLWKTGESLALSPAEDKLCRAARDEVTSEDPMVGLLEAWLERPLPGDWEYMSIDARQRWLRAFGDYDRSNGLEGGKPLEQVCTLQLWTEALGRRPGENRRIDNLILADVLRRLGWIPLGLQNHPQYGRQRVWERPPTGADLGESEDLL